MEKKVRVRCWIDVNDEKFFGPGPAELLQHIEQTGSMAKAAKVMNMSYKKAWSIVGRLNEHGHEPYVLLHKGGGQGGGAELTDAGRKVVAAYLALVAKINAVVKEDKELIGLI